MKKLFLTFTALGVAGLITSALAQTETNAPDENNGPQPGMSPDAGGPPPDAVAGMPPDAPDQNASAENSSNGNSGRDKAIVPTKPFAADKAAVASDFMPPATGTNSDALMLNFRNAPLEMVLNYLSDAAGFIVVLNTPVQGSVSVISGHPVTKDEAVSLLNSVLNQNGYAAIRNGRTLTILDKNDAKTRNIPVKIGNDPKNIPENAEIVTQIIPIRFVDASKLVTDLSSFVSPQATVVANDDGNSIVITDTQANIHHIAEIIQAIDNSAEAETEIKVFRLQYASPTDVASELGSVFPSSGSTSGSGNTQSPIRFGGFGGFGGFGRMFGGGGGGGGAAAAGNSSSDRIKKETQVTAVADARIQAVIVTAPKDLMEEIADMMKTLDVPSERDQQVYTFHLDNADPQQAAQVLQNMFQSASSSRSSSSSSSTQSPLQLRQQNTATSTSSSGTTAGSTFSTGTGGGGGR